MAKDKKSKKASKSEKSSSKSNDDAKAIVERLKKMTKRGEAQASAPYIKFNSRTTDFNMHLFVKGKKKQIDLNLVTDTRDNPKKQAVKATRLTIDFKSIKIGAAGYPASKKDDKVVQFKFHELPEDYDTNQINEFISTLPPILDSKGNALQTKFGDARWSPAGTFDAIAEVDGKEVYCTVSFDNARLYYSTAELITDIIKAVDDNNIEATDLITGLCPVVYVSGTPKIGDYYAVKFEVEDFKKVDFDEVKVKALKALAKEAKKYSDKKK